MRGVLKPTSMLDLEKTQALCQAWSLPYLSELSDGAYALQWHAGRLTLISPMFEPWTLDYQAPQWQRLARSVRQRPPSLVKALGQPLAGVKVLDLTLGWGRDAFIAATLGARVIGLEREPMVAAMVAHALASTPLFEVHAEDAAQTLDDWVQRFNPDVIYLDPMFAVKKKALVKKRMQLLQGLCQPSAEGAQWVARLSSSASKVVCKQPRSAPVPPGWRALVFKTGQFLIKDR